jgi:hypothetical protein
MKSLDRATLFRVCSWADEGEIERAGEKAEHLLREGVYDFQLVVLWLAYRFAREGVVSLERIVLSATEQLLADLEAAAPADRVDEGRALDRSFSWLVVNVTQRMHFHSKTRDEVWSRWVKSLEADSLDQLSARIASEISRLDGAFLEMADPTSSGELRKLERRFRSGFGAIVEELGARRARESAPPAQDTPDEGDVAEMEHEDVSEEPAPVERSSTAVDAPAQSFGSERLRLLQRKLEGFEKLAGQRALREAGIVARDIERELAQFDPLQYLPEMFAGYLTALCDVGAELEEYMGEGDGIEQRALERLYSANPLQFIERAERGRDE